MKKNSITIKHSLLINKPREVVWDYTQHIGNRMKWDKNVLAVAVIQEKPNRIIKLKLKGNTSMTLVYKLDDRPSKTSLLASAVESSFIELAGGSWSYEAINGSTLWNQTNTITFKKHYFLKFMLPVYKFLFIRSVKRAMLTAKREIEKL